MTNLRRRQTVTKIAREVALKDKIFSLVKDIIIIDGNTSYGFGDYAVRDNYNDYDYTVGKLSDGVFTPFADITTEEEFNGFLSPIRNN